MNKMLKNKIQILENEFENNKDNLDFQVMEQLINDENVKKILAEIQENLPLENQSINEVYLMGLTKNKFLIEMLCFYLENNNITIKPITNENENFIHSSSFSQYMQEIGRYPLLTEEQEKQYFTKLRNGDNRYREIIINSNLRLVVSVAKRYITLEYGIGDLIQDGNMGLMEAVNRFDVTKGYKFSTYATWWIRQAITRAIANNSRTIRIPVHRFEELKFYRRCKQELYLEYGKIPSKEDLATYMTSKKMNTKRKKYTVDDIIKLENDDTQPMSLETKIGEENDMEIGETIKDEKQNVEEDIANLFLKRYIEEIMEEVLDEREKKIINMRFGLNGEDQKTLQAAGKELHITRERVRQIESKALRKLRNPKRSIKIKDYIN